MPGKTPDDRRDLWGNQKTEETISIVLHPIVYINFEFVICMPKLKTEREREREITTPIFRKEKLCVHRIHSGLLDKSKNKAKREKIESSVIREF